MGGSRLGAHVVGGEHLTGQPANTKQLMRLLDSIKTLGDENAALLREVEDAEAARAEAKATREQMGRFKAEYGKRFAALKSALEKFRKSYPEQNANGSNPVTSR
jgi:regulator of protease activity HflC (stomatin/prohibitin superfamily)